VPSCPINSLHGASTEDQVDDELRFFFPVEQTVAAIKPNVPNDKREQIEKRILKAGFHIAAKKNQKLSNEVAQAIYREVADKPYFNDLISLVTK
jgi:nucleoside diphosphate kinase